MAELDTSCRRRTSFTGMPWLSNATLAGPAGVAPSSPVLAYQSEDPTAGCTMLAPDAVARSKYPAATHELTRQSCDKVVIGFRIPQQEFQNDFHSVKKNAVKFSIDRRYYINQYCLRKRSFYKYHQTTGFQSKQAHLLISMSVYPLKIQGF